MELEYKSETLVFFFETCWEYASTRTKLKKLEIVINRDCPFYSQVEEI